MNRSEAGRLGGLALRKKYRDEYAKQPNLCAHCGKPLPYDKRHNKHCNQSCNASHNNFGRVRNPRRRNKCRICGTETSTSENVYCDECIKKGEHVRKVSCLKDAKTDATRKRILIIVRGHECEECTNTQWNGRPIPLELEHIDGNSENNDDSNLKLLCPNCHAQTPTYKCRNRGKGRHKRRQRYKNGQSY